MMAMNLMSSYKTWLKYRETRSELSRLDSRELADLGNNREISPADRFLATCSLMKSSITSSTRSATKRRLACCFSVAGSRPSVRAANILKAAARAWCRVTRP